MLNYVFCVNFKVLHHETLLHFCFIKFKYFIADPSSLNNMSMISLQSALHCHYKNSSSSKEHDEQVFWFLERMGRMKSFIINKMVNIHNFIRN